MNLKTAIALGALLLLAGCGWFERATATYTGWSRLCVAGVSYLQFTSGATVEYTPEGRIKTCPSTSMKSEIDAAPKRGR